MKVEQVKSTDGSHGLRFGLEVAPFFTLMGMRDAVELLKSKDGKLSDYFATEPNSKDWEVECST